MTAANFPKALALVLKSEGGNDDDPADHGGRTSRGITQREYNAWRGLRGLGNKDVWTASDKDVADIYHEEYWNPWCDLLPAGIDYLFFDMAVNAGPRRAIILLQRALGVTDDGRIGPITKMAIRDADPDRLIDDFSEAKKAFYLSLHQPRFTKGWLNRTASVRKAALQMVAGIAQPAVPVS